MLEWIASVPDSLRHPFLVRDLSEAFRLNEQVLLEELRRVVTGASQRPAPAQGASSPVAVSEKANAGQQAPSLSYKAALLPSERELIRIALTAQDGLAILLNEAGITSEQFWSEGGRKIFSSIMEGQEERGNAADHVLHDPALSSDERREVADIMFGASSPSTAWKNFDVEVPDYEVHRSIRDALLGIAIHRVHQRIDAATQALELMADIDQRKQQMFDIAHMIQLREQLRSRFAHDPRDLSWLHADQTR
jgi:hypothetical protein